MKEPVLAWHFTDGMSLRDGQKLVVGKEYVFDGEPIMCACGYHASRSVWDALSYAPGNVLSRVECRDVVDSDESKLVCRSRTVLQTLDVENVLWNFARRCALDVIQLWNAPEVVVEYLKTGNEELRDAARDAAWDAARDAAWDAERKWQIERLAYYLEVE